MLSAYQFQKKEKSTSPHSALHNHSSISFFQKKKTAQRHRVHILHLCGEKNKNGGVEGCLMQWKSYTDNSEATAEAELGSLEKGRKPSSVFCIERVALVSFAPGGNQKAKIISGPIVCSCNHFREPPREEIKCLKAKPISLFLGDMLLFWTRRFWVPSAVWVMGPRGALQTTESKFCLFTDRKNFLAAFQKKISSLDLCFQVANPHAVFWI